MINFTSKPRYALDDLIRLVHALRAPGGCPWDAAQTHLSIRRNFLEEAYEACEALDCDDAAMIREFLQTLRSGRGSKTSADASVESHLIALAAEESRLQNGTAIHMKEWRTTV